jgi:hypothetical protein
VNYLAHARLVLHDPALVAGTSLPDWLRVVDKRARILPRTLEPLVLVPDSFADRLRRGVLQHHHDDHEFHTHAVFDELTHEAVHHIRALSSDPQLRASVLGHIAVEMLLDAAIEDAQPGSIARYYDALAALDIDELARLARVWTARPLERLEELFTRFCRSRFLFAYASNDGVVDALSGVCARAGLTPPPPGIARVITRLRPRVQGAAAALLA